MLRASDVIFMLASAAILAGISLLVRLLSRRQPAKSERQHETYTIQFTEGLTLQLSDKDEAGRCAVLHCYLRNGRIRRERARA